MRRLYPLIILFGFLLFTACTVKETSISNTINEVKLLLPTIQNTSAGINSYVLDDNTIAINISNDEAYNHSGIHLYDSRSGELIRTLAQDSEIKNDLMAFSPDGTLVATAEYFYNDKIKLWQVSDGELLNTFTIDSNFQSNEVILNKTKNIYELVTDGPDGIKDIFFSPDGKIVGAYTKQEFQQYWDVSSGEKLNRLRRNPLDLEHNYYISINTSLSNPEDWKTEIRRLDDDTLVSSFKAISSSSFDSRLSPSGRVVIVTGEYNKTTLHQTKTGEIITSLPGKFVEISQDESFLITNNRNLETDDFESIIWEIATGKQITSVNSTQIENSVYIPEIAFSPDSSMATILSVTNRDIKNLKLIQLSDGEILLNFDHDIFRGEVTYNDDSSKIAIGVLENQHRLNINVWDISNNFKLSTYRADGPREWSANLICFVGKDKLMALGNKTRIWRTEDSTVLWNEEFYVSPNPNICHPERDSDEIVLTSQDGSEISILHIPYVK